MRVAVEPPLRIAVLGLIAGEVPNDQGLVSAGGEEHVGAVSTVSAGPRRRIHEPGGSYFSIDVAKLVTQPFCDALSALVPGQLGARRRQQQAVQAIALEAERNGSKQLRAAGTTYVALQGALKDELLSHLAVLPEIQRSVEE